MEKKWDYDETIYELFIYFPKTCDSVRREILYNILIEFGVPMKLVRLIKICLNETYNKVRIAKHLSDSFPILNGLKQGDALSSLLGTTVTNQNLIQEEIKRRLNSGNGC
jgi:hypothetical protein